MRKSCVDEFSSVGASTTTQICSYCEEHRKLRETLLLLRNQRNDYHRAALSPRLSIKLANEFTDDATFDSSNSKSSSRRKLLAASAVERKNEQQLTPTAGNTRSPTASCLKHVGSKKETLSKRVDFHAQNSYIEASSNDRSTYADDFRDDPYKSHSSDYYEPEQYEKLRNATAIVRRASTSSRKSSTASYEDKASPYSSYASDTRSSRAKEREQLRTFAARTVESNAKQPAAIARDGSRATSTRANENLDFTSSATAANDGGSFYAARSGAARRRGHLTAEQTTLSPHAAATTVVSKCSKHSDQLLGRFERLSVTSSRTCCASESTIPSTRLNELPPPKVVKAKDSLSRAAVKRMIVYPPEGQVGPPLTLLKKWSNVDCRVGGDPRRGYKYKVYYLQEYESDRWFPDDRTGGPFRDVGDDDWTTDCG